MSEHTKWRQDKIYDDLYYITGMNDKNLPELFATALTEKRAREIVEAVNGYATLKAQRDELLAMLKEEHWGRARCLLDDYGLTGKCPICSAIANAEKPPCD